MKQKYWYLNMRIRVLFNILITFFISSCSNNELDFTEYIKYFDSDKNGLNKVIETGQFKLEFKYRSKEYMALKSLNTIELNSLSHIDSMVQNSENNVTIIMKVFTLDGKSSPLSQGINNESEYYNRVGYLNSDVKNDIFLVSGEDTIPCIIHHFERTYNMTNYLTLIFAFDKKNIKTNNPLDIHFGAKIFGIDNKKITFDKTDLNHIPKLVL